jgi:hypothetical protein
MLDGAGLNGAGGERAYAHAFSVAQWAVSAGLLLGMIVAIPPQRRRVS